MRWKIFAIISIGLYLNALYQWFSGGYSPTILHYIMIVVQLPVTVATLCYAFELTLATARFWRLTSWGLIFLVIATVVEDIGPLAKVYEMASSATLKSVLLASAFILAFEILAILMMWGQYVAISRFLRIQRRTFES